MALSHEMILAAGILGLLAIFAALFAARIGTPFLLAFIALGMAAGEDGLGGIPFDDFQTGYLIGSLALAIILFDGGLSLNKSTIKAVAAPALSLATIGVALSAGIIGAAEHYLWGVQWLPGLLLGAAVAPTDAAAVSMMLRQSGVAVSERVAALLELESGLNDPMSVFLTIALVAMIGHPASIGFGHGALLFAEEMGGGAAIGLAGGIALLLLLKQMPTRNSLYPVTAFSVALLLFGGAQMLGASGFLAVFLAGAMVGVQQHEAANEVKHFFEAVGWMAQICLFLMLGLLVTPRDLLPLIFHSLITALVLIFLARPLSVASCMAPFGWRWREAAFVAWAGLRGGVPIFLAIIPVLANKGGGERLFNAVFVTVIASVAIQGKALAWVARLLKIKS